MPTLSARNPGIIFAIGTGFGLEGPNKHKGGQDILAQATTGVMERVSNVDDPVTIYPTALCDYSAGMHLVQGILLALLQRAKTGKGQTVAVSLYNSMLAMQMQEAAAHMMRGRDLNWGAFPLTGVFQTTDRPFVMVGAFKENPLRDICQAMEVEDLSKQDRFATFDKQAAHKAELQALFRNDLCNQGQRSLARAAGSRRYSLRSCANARRSIDRRTDRREPDDPRRWQNGSRSNPTDRLAHRHVRQLR